MDQPEPAEGWPDRPLSPAEAEAFLTGEPPVDAAVDGDPVAVWVMDHEEGVRSTVVPDDAPDDAVVDVVVETDAAFEMFSYTRGRWVDYGTQRKADDEAPSMAGTLASYRLLAGESDLDGEDDPDGDESDPDGE